jgi:hypothetical protein
LDTITDFTLGTDLISLRTFADAATSPTGLLFAGTVTAASLGAALTLAISDANGSLSGTPAQADGNAVMFVYGGNTYAYIDTVSGAFNAADANNLLIKITGALDLTQGVVAPTTIFA